MALCPRCKCDESTVRYDLGAARIRRCSGCRLLYLDPWPGPEATAAVYGKSYFQNREFLASAADSLFGYVDYVAERFNKQYQYARIARDVRGLLRPLNRPRRLLEVGCGFGYFLDEAFEEGFEVSGVEFSPHAVDRLRRKYAFPILSGPLESIELQRGGFDVVVMLDVIEHLRDPFGSLDKLHDALAPGGILVLTTPDAESWVSRSIGKRLEDFRRTREHLVFFGRDTLESVLDEHGFELLSVRSIGHTFELRFLLDRLTLYNRFLFRTLGRIVERLGLGGLQVRINPLTKMIGVARRRGGRRSGSSITSDSRALESVSELDRTLIEELQTLERTGSRHYRWVFEQIEPFLGRTVLEVGSGIGVISKFLLPRSPSLVLSDHQQVHLSMLRERFGELEGVRYELLDLNEPPYRLEIPELDTVVCLNVLEHIQSDDEALRGLANLLPRRGRLVLQVPNHPRLFGSLDESYGHVRRYSPRTLREKLERAGFRLVSQRRFDPFSIPGWILAGRILGRRRLDVGALRVHDALVPILRLFDFSSRFAGLSLIVCAERR